MKIAMIGAGGWGTAMVASLAEHHTDIYLYCRNPEKAKQIAERRENREYLPGIFIPGHVQVGSDLKEAVMNSDCVILSVPSRVIEETAKTIMPWIKSDGLIVCASKGLADESGRRLSEAIAEQLKGVTNRIVALSGPNHAEEVGLGLPTASVAASEVPEAVQVVQDVFMSPTFRVYRSHDIRGVEYGGALKNIIALACGVLAGLGLGDNTRAALMTRGLLEITRFGLHFGAKRETFYGLSGMGDLIATCTSMHSRNYSAGLLLAKGKSVQEVLDETNMVIEGVRTAFLVEKIAEREHINMPVTREFCRMLKGENTAEEALTILMTRAKKAETETYDIEDLQM